MEIVGVWLAEHKKHQQNRRQAHACRAGLVAVWNLLRLRGRITGAIGPRLPFLEVATTHVWTLGAGAPAVGWKGKLT